MATETVRSLLAKWEIDGSSWTAAVSSYRSLIRTAASEDAVRASASKKAQTESISAALKEIDIRKALQKADQAVVSATGDKARATKQLADANKASAAELLASTKQQIAAEQLKAAVIRTAMLEQQRAQQQALIFEKAYNAQVQEQAKNKAKAAAIFDEAYRAQVAEVDRNKKAPLKVNSPDAVYSSIPIAKAPDERQTLNPGNTLESQRQTDVEEVASRQEIIASYEEQTKAVRGTAEAVASEAKQTVEANRGVVLSNIEVSDSYKRIATAQLELERANANVNETRKAIASGTYNGSDAEGRLATDLRDKERAQVELTNARAVSDERVLQLERSQTAEKERQIEAARKLTMVNEAYSMNKQFDDAKRKANELRKQQEYENQSWFSKLKQNFSPGAKTEGDIGIGRKEKDTIDALMGRQTIGPIDTLISKIPGLKEIISTAFPLVGIAAFAGMAVEAGTAIYELYKHTKEFASIASNAFGGSLAGLQEQNDQLKLRDDNLKNTIAILEHKPTDNISPILDQIRIKTDGIYKAAIAARKELASVLEEGGVGAFAGFAQNKANTGDIQKKMQELEQDRIDAAQTYQTTAQETTNLKDPVQKQRLDAAKAAVIRANKAEEDYANDQFKEIQRRRAGKDLTTGEKFQAGFRSLLDAAKKQGGIPSNMNVLLGPVAGAKAAVDLVGTNTGVGIDQDTKDRERMLTYIRNRSRALTGNLNITDDLESDEKRQKDDQDKKRASEVARADDRARLEAEEKNTQSSQKAQRDALQDLIDANEELYKKGDLDAKKYYENKRMYAQKTYEDTVAFAKQTQEIQLRYLALDKKNSDGSMTNVQYGARKQGIEQDTLGKLSDADRVRKVAVTQINEAQGVEENRVAKQTIDANLKAHLDSLEIQRTSVKHAFDQETIYATEYLASTKKLIQEELNAKIEAAEKEKVLNGPRSSANGALDKRIQDAKDQYTKQMTDLDDQSGQLRLRSVQTRYSAQQNLLGAQANYAGDPNNLARPSDKLVINGQQQVVQLQQIGELESLKETAEKYSAIWYQISTEIQNAREHLTELRTEGEQLKNPVQQLGKTGQDISQAMSTVFTSRYARGLESALSAGSASAAAAPGYVKGMTEGSWLQRDSGTGKINVNDTIDSFAKHLSNAVGAVGSFIQSISNAGSASAGALGGGISGAGLGSSLGQSGALGSTLGPYGAAIGAGAGIILGGIMGQKQEEVQDDLNQLNASFKSIMSEYGANNSSLNATIIKLQALIVQAQEDMANTKKGGSQFKDLIQQYNEQIVQLQNQQKQIMADLSNQLIQISSPEAYQPIISSIEDVVKQYTQFVGAAQNANDLAKANEYLETSLANLGQSYSETLMQNEETAISDALQLNQLYNQRNQLQQQYLEQVRGIMGQGTLTRGTTQAQSKYSKLYDLDVNHQQQMEQINQQISLEEYKVSAESKIFDLANTRIGLENQLLQLQEQGVNLDMARIVAMQNTLSMLQKTGYSLTDLGSLNTSDPNQLTSTLLSILAQQLGVNVGGSNNLTSAAAAAFGTSASFGYGQFRV